MSKSKAGTSHRDPGLISNEPYEVEYVHSQFPNRSHQEVQNAIDEAKRELHGSEDRQKIMQILRRKLN